MSNDRVFAATQRVTVIVQDGNDGGKMHGELVLAVGIAGGVEVSQTTDMLGQAHFELGPGEYRFELSPPERGSSHRNQLVLPALEHERRINFSIEPR